MSAPVEQVAAGSMSRTAWVVSLLRRDAVRLGLLVMSVGMVLAVLATRTPAPVFFPDELIYLDAASAVARGETPAVRGEEYGYGPVYPVLVAPLVAVSPDREVAATVVKAFNALLFAAAAFPVFFVARRLMSRGWALVAAALSIAIPSSVYAAHVQTESAAYFAFALFLLALVRAFEKPTAGRLVALAATLALAAGIRLQLLVLLPATLLALGTALAVLPRSSWASRLTRLGLPTAAVGVIGMTVLLTGVVGVGDVLGAYDVLWQSYDMRDLARRSLDHAGLVVLYVAVVPVVVAPIALIGWFRSARRGSSSHAVLLGAFVAINAAAIAVVAAFSTTSFAGEGLHDRMLFWVAPLWMIVLCDWLGRGMPRPVIALAAGVAAAVTAVLLVPYPQPSGFLLEALALAPWEFVERGNPNGEPFSGREALLGFTALAAVAACAVPRHSRWVVVVCVASMLVFTGSLAWATNDSASGEIDADAFDPGMTRPWIDAEEYRPDSVTLLSVPSPCGDSRLYRSVRLTEFFNDAVGRGVYLVSDDPLAPPTQRVVLSGQTLVDADTRRPVRAELVLTRAGVELDGKRLARGTRTPLELWRTRTGVMRFTHAPRSLPCES